MAENILNLMKNISLYILEAHWILTKINPKRSMLAHQNLWKANDKKPKTLNVIRQWQRNILESNKIEWLIIHNESSIFTADFSSETMEASRQWIAYSKCWERLSTKNFTSNKIILQKQESIKKLPDFFKCQNPLLADLTDKKYWKKHFRLKWKDSRQELETMGRNRKHQERYLHKWI